MRRLLASRGTSAALVGIVMLLVAGGGYALASGSSSITVCVKKHGGALYKAKKCKKGDSKLTWNKTGPQGNTGPAGATGATGAPGAPGAAGAPALVSLGSWAGGISDTAIPGDSSVYDFAGPTTALTTTATQSIAVTGSAALGTSTGTATIALGICVQTPPSGALTLLNQTPGTAIEEVTVTTTRIPFAAAAAGIPGAGTWNVGICVKDVSAQGVDSNDWSIGYASVSNATASAASAASASAANVEQHHN